MNSSRTPTFQPLPAVCRRGISTLWVIIVLPILLLLFCFVINVANIWLARVELENGLEAAALAAVKHWGDADGGSTLPARRVGVAYAHANAVRCLPLEIRTNYDDQATSENPNENLKCRPSFGDPTHGIPPSGNLVFGAFVRETPDGPKIFDAGLVPSCSLGLVVFDVTGEGRGNLAHDDAWGVAFHPNEQTPPDLRIVRIVFDLGACGGPGRFVSPGPVLSSNEPPHAVHDNHTQQPDIKGFSDPEEQIEFSSVGSGSRLLVIEFSADDCDDDDDDDDEDDDDEDEEEDDDDDCDRGFEPGDRFRFGASVDGVSSGNGRNDGDGIGRDGVRVTVFYELGGVALAPVSAHFKDTTHRSNECLNPALIDPLTGSLIVHPNRIADIPCPHTSSRNNNGQSLAFVDGPISRPYAVRAAAIVEVPLIGGRWCGLGSRTYCVSAKTTAIYNCSTRRPQLVRIDEFICP